MMAILLATLPFTQFGAEKPPQAAGVGLQALFDRAAKEPDLNGAGLVLSSLLADEAKLRAAFATDAVLDDRSLFGIWKDWGIHVRGEDIDEIRREMGGNFPRDDPK